MKVDKKFLIWIVVGIIFLLFTAYCVGGIVNVAKGDSYTVKKSAGWLDRADGTNNLTDKAIYLESALEELDDLQGNPKWFFATERTDIGLIKLNIEECMNQTVQASKLSINNMSYQLSIENLDQSIGDIRDDLDSVNSWFYLTKNALINIFIFLSLSAVFFYTMNVLTDVYKRENKFRISDGCFGLIFFSWVIFIVVVLGITLLLTSV